jgi:NAD-reducing hydrogenase small subunit
MRWCRSITSSPGCPPLADAIWKVLTDLLAGNEPELGHGLMHYD